MTDVRIVREYPHPPAKVWRALTDPVLMKLWLVAARPEHFSTVVGARFEYVGKPQIGWSGVVDCEVLEAREPSVFRYSWTSDGSVATEVAYRIDPRVRGARFTFEHTGFTGIGGFLIAKALIAPIRKRMFGSLFPALLDDMDDGGNLVPGSKLKPLFV